MKRSNGWLIAGIFLAGIGWFAGYYSPHPQPGTPLPFLWRPDGRPYECVIEADTGHVGFCLTQAQLDAAASPSPKATP